MGEKEQETNKQMGRCVPGSVTFGLLISYFGPDRRCTSCVTCLLNKSLEKIKWEKVGQLESDLCVHDMVSIGDGQQAIMFPAEQDKLLESLLAQVRVDAYQCAH